MSNDQLLGATLYADPLTLLIFALGVGCVLLLCGGAGLYAMRDQRALRLRRVSESFQGTQETLLRKTDEVTPTGWKKALIPDDPTERAQIRFQLASIGFDRANIVELYFVTRLGLAVLVPALVLSIVTLAHAGLLPGVLADVVLTTSKLTFLQITAVGAAVGFYGPGYWLNGRIKARQAKIRAAFPNALDLVQISVEAGLGFDAAVTRVGEEIGRVAPELAYEFLLLQIEIQAGRDREAALFDMAERMGIDEAKSFALVIIQSLQFGTSLTASLKHYAAEMREMRELAAQEKANKLPVQMSGVMSVLMLPALFLITLTPIIIRYMSIY